MTAKELQQAAEYVVTQWDNHDSKRLVAGDELFFNSDGEPDAVSFARHILATVRDDDDEPIEWKWLATVLNADTTEQDARLFDIGNYLTINEVSNSRGKLHEVYCHFQKVATIKNRGQFRALCKGLGIVLEEGTTC